jgi:hypothetical protein
MAFSMVHAEVSPEGHARDSTPYTQQLRKSARRSNRNAPDVTGWSGRSMRCGIRESGGIDAQSLTEN